jgi:hypothetical protein
MVSNINDFNKISSECIIVLKKIEIDECSESQNICGTNARCLNTPGSYKCECELGYELDLRFGSNVKLINPCKGFLLNFYN